MNVLCIIHHIYCYAKGKIIKIVIFSKNLFTSFGIFRFFSFSIHKIMTSALISI